MGRIRSALGLLVLSLALAACVSTRSDTIAYDRTDFGEPDAAPVATLAADYRIAPLDKLAVNVFQVEQLSGQYQVELTGTIALPLLGSVSAAGLTTAELQQSLEEKLSVDLLKNPDVTVGLLEATGSNITLEGSLNNPGVYPNFGRTSLVQAIALAGGMDEYANPKRVIIFRTIEGQRMAAAFDMTTIRRGVDDDPEVYRGDIIIVEGSRTRRAWLDVVQSIPLVSAFRPVF